MPSLLRATICVVLCLAVVGACATMATQTPEQLYIRHRAVLKLAVQIGVVEFLSHHKELAQPVADIAGAVRDEWGGELQPLDFLHEAVQQKMISMQVSATQQLLILNLMDLLMQTMRTYFVEQDLIPAQIRMLIGEISGWIAEVAQRQVES